MSDYNDINDNEIRIIGNAEQPRTTRRKPLYRKWWFWALLVALILLSLTPWLLTRNINRKLAATSEVGVVENEPSPTHPYIVECEPATVLVRDTAINDVSLRLYLPVNALPELQVGNPDPKDESIILALQAADIRADNQEIVGAFVRKGELLSRGSAKKGFCAIIDWSIQLGMAENTPLFEESIDKEGDFFRQYPLVVEGKMVENKPKGKALRRALCEMDGKILAVSSMERESFHDFAQALADMGVQNAIYLTGADAYGFCRSDADGTPKTTVWGVRQTGKAFENVNFIVWRVAE